LSVMVSSKFSAEISIVAMQCSSLKIGCSSEASRQPLCQPHTTYAYSIPHYLMATRRRIGIATSTTSRFLTASSKYSIARSTRDQRVFGR
jgi:hypothetical protein